MLSSNRTILEKVQALHQLFQAGQIPTLATHEVHPDLPLDSRENYLYFTLAPCLNFQRNSPALWQAALKTYHDSDTQYLFFPERVVNVTREKIQADLLKHKLSLQKNKHTDIWIVICKAFFEHYDSDPRQLFIRNDWDVRKILETIQITYRKNFPYLSGPKMSNYWLYIISQYTDAEFLNMQEISIIPDTHVLQSSVKLGITETLGTPLVVAELWKELLEDSGLTPVQMHPVLWNWSRNNFLPEV
jgi:hypothetical protein